MFKDYHYQINYSTHCLEDMNIFWGKMRNLQESLFRILTSFVLLSIDIFFLIRKPIVKEIYTPPPQPINKCTRCEKSKQGRGLNNEIDIRRRGVNHVSLFNYS